MKKTLFTLAGLLLVLGCSAMNKEDIDKQSPDTEVLDTKTLWIAGHKVDCVGVGPMRCMLVSHNDSLADAEWKLMYDDIHGFDFLPGYYQKLLVRIESLPPELVPADASSQRTTLVKHLDKKKDTNPPLDGHWTTLAIGSVSIELASAPHLEIDSNQMTVSGYDSCNQYRGKLLQLDQNSIHFGPQASTRKMCRDMSAADRFAQALLDTRTFQINGDQLQFFNEQNQLVLEFNRTTANLKSNAQ